MEPRKPGTVEYAPTFAANMEATAFETSLKPDEFTRSMVSFNLSWGKRGGPILNFEEVGDMLREKDRLRAEIKIRQDADLSSIQTFLPPALTDIESGNPVSWAIWKNQVLSNKLLAEVAPRVQAVLDVIYQEARAFLTIKKLRIDYTEMAWKKAALTMKKALSGKPTIADILAAQRVAFEEHKTDLKAFEKTRQEKNQAPVSRRLANQTHLFYAAKNNLTIAQDGHEVIAASDWALIQKKVREAQENGVSAMSFATAALQSPDYSGEEVLCLVGLIQYVREKAGLKTPKGTQNKLDSIVLDPSEFLERLGLTTRDSSNVDKSRERRRMETAMRDLARREITLPAQKEDAGSKITAKGFRSGFFLFESLSVSSPEGEAGSWKFTGLDLLQILTEEDTPFRPIPIDPFRYIAEQLEPRERKDAARLLWEILIIQNITAKERTWRLSEFNLSSGDGTTKEQAGRKQAVIKHALERYAGGGVKIESGLLTITPGSDVVK